VWIDLRLRLMERNAWIDAVYKRWEFDVAFTHFENGADPDIGVKRVYISSNIVPFVDSFRPLCLAPTPDMKAVFYGLEHLALAG
jgi:hypothetical protein